MRRIPAMRCFTVARKVLPPVILRDETVRLTTAVYARQSRQRGSTSEKNCRALERKLPDNREPDHAWLAISNPRPFIMSELPACIRSLSPARMRLIKNRSPSGKSPFS